MNLHTEEIQKLKEERTETEAKIEKLRHQNERLKNRERYLTKRDRAARTHRLCVTGGIVESILPEVKTLTEAEQYEQKLDPYALRACSGHLRGCSRQNDRQAQAVYPHQV